MPYLFQAGYIDCLERLWKFLKKKNCYSVERFDVKSLSLVSFSEHSLDVIKDYSN